MLSHALEPLDRGPYSLALLSFFSQSLYAFQAACRRS